MRCRSVSELHTPGNELLIEWPPLCGSLPVEPASNILEVGGVHTIPDTTKTRLNISVLSCPCSGAVRNGGSRVGFYTCSVK